MREKRYLNEPYKCQAIGMACDAGINDLTPEQINEYRIQARTKTSGESDQQTLYPILNPNQRPIFKEKFGRILILE